MRESALQGAGYRPGRLASPPFLASRSWELHPVPSTLLQRKQLAPTLCQGKQRAGVRTGPLIAGPPAGKAAAAALENLPTGFGAAYAKKRSGRRGALGAGARRARVRRRAAPPSGTGGGAGGG